MSFLNMTKQVLAHPIDFYNDLQEPGRARIRDGILMIALVIAFRMISLLLSSILYQQREAFEISFVTEAVSIIVLWLTWSISNWGVSTIQDGEGRFKEILVGSAYALAPYALLIIPISLLTNVMTLQEMPVYVFLTGFLFVWVAFLLIMKVKIIHDFTLYKLIFILLLTIVGMLIIWFVFIMIYGLVNQAFNFVFGIVKELNLRM
ncbi:YIP1 family protein [Paenibacillus oceani]|uniref:YIP1 family protein n=1 Tax=Paenibacillus oceani TaxID=2772510 RepID=A0A927C7L6_9BACL|nr:YIP1 family protein [Paenibacillus oceani]MBD2861517.1 YIP1 family protein [Paenibacillus oceani]